MPQSFDIHNPPFDRLTHGEANDLRAALDIGYFHPGEVIVEHNAASDQLHVIIKGAVEERDGDEVVARLGPKTASMRARSCTAPPAAASSPPRRRFAISCRVPRSSRLSATIRASPRSSIRKSRANSTAIRAASSRKAWSR